MTGKHEKLRNGFTTGTAAAAATKAALKCLIEKRSPTHVAVQLLTGESIRIAVHACERVDDVSAACTVIKDAGDDPDVTNGAEIGARVTLLTVDVSGPQGESVVIKGGRGVGRVTKPGLEVPPGQPAINPGPQRMIAQAVGDVLRQHGLNRPVRVEVFVPAGEVLARKTLNARLGILGGISILGTTGIVTPMSHAAYTATIRSALSVARACGHERVVLTTGRRSERYAQYLWPSLPEETFVQIGDYFQYTLQTTEDMGFNKVSLVVFFGKAVKMAQGVPHTHAARSQLSLQKLAQWVAEANGSNDLISEVKGANTARQVFDAILTGCPGVIERVGREIVRAARNFSGSQLKVQSIILDFEGRIAFDSDAGGTKALRL